MPTFEHDVTVRWVDADAQGHINHAVLFTYLEEGRDAFFSQRLDSTNYAVVHIEADIRREVRLDARTVRVEIQLERLGQTSITTREAILNPHGDIILEGSIVIVKWDPTARKTLALTRDERARLQS
jgi:YbgC/YbaW family acyl-CoA thioester hydrolase